ncbi:Alba DNA/RNA-binding protein [Quillaja saponaria]|uniref:Alba DNA/RNA-binding protein n=1 Tax=Quillaja saponaria TaxID=32244 RepID=A0AAD7LBQ1_QUISA|nr:Alba DNA/RNA-binding protein [Quillaja saponaria]
MTISAHRAFFTVPKFPAYCTISRERRESSSMESSVVVAIDEVTKAMEEVKIKEEFAVAVGGEDKIATTTESQKKKKNRIQVSNTKKPLIFYLKLAQKYIKQHNDVELSALGMAIPTVVLISEILKRNGVAFEKNIMISTVGSKEVDQDRKVQKAKIEILLGRAEKVKQTTVAAASKKGSGNDNKA